MKTNKLPPIHPGEILREEFMKPRGLSQNALARALNVPPRRINEIVLEKRSITADTALRLARYFGTSAEMWTGLQADYDLRLARYEKARTIEREVEPLCGVAASDGMKLITTRPYSDTIIARIKREPKFARLLYASAINAILEGETAEGLSILRDLVNAQTSFKELARQTGLGEKSLHRMLNHNGNPTARNLGLIVKSIAEDLDIKPRVEFA